MSVYFIAVILALMMIIIDETAKRKSFKFVLKRWQYWSCMLMVTFIMLSCVVWPYQDIKGTADERWSKTSNAWYYALGRPAWGTALALMTFAFKYMDSDSGQQSMVKSFLS